ncbi:F-box/LRR-repeat protein 2-like protein [Drosera capensis]
MENSDSPAESLSATLKKLELVTSSAASSSSPSSFQFPVLPFKRTKPPSLVGLCLAIIGKHLEEIIPDLREIATSFPPDIKMAIAAVARRRKLLDDEVIISLADASWEILDISCSEVTDYGLEKVSEICRSLLAVDISRCRNVTPFGVSQLVQHCQALETLRCGGCPRSDDNARKCLGLLKLKLNDLEGDSWEELDTTEITHGARSLRWLVWPNIDPDSLESFSAECPQVKVNPKPSPLSLKGFTVPREALQGIVLDEPVVKELNPSAWSVCGPVPNKIMSMPILSPTELSIAEKFRLAFMERDTRLAPKRAKNARQHQRRAKREWMMTNTDAKAIAHASNLSRSLNRDMFPK